MYETLLKEAHLAGVEVFEMDMVSRTGGLYGDNVIWVKKQASTIEKTCILAEELGHHHASFGDILTQFNVVHRKQEKRGRNWGYRRLVTLDCFIRAHKAGVSNRYEFAQFLDVTESFIDQSIQHYREKFGLMTTHKGYMIILEPFIIVDPISFE